MGGSILEPHPLELHALDDPPIGICSRTTCVSVFSRQSLILVVWWHGGGLKPIAPEATILHHLVCVLGVHMSYCMYCQIP